MATKLDWQDQPNGEGYAAYKGLRIRAVLDVDDSPGDWFHERDGNWPMAVRSSDDSMTATILGDKGDPWVSWPLGYFGDAQLIHWQVHIAKLFGTTVRRMLREAAGPALSILDEGAEEFPPYSTDAGALRDAFSEELGCLADRDCFTVWVGMYELLGIPHLLTTVGGWSQGKGRELLIVATPAARERLLGGDGADWTAEQWRKDFEAQAENYRAWATGDVYGYVVEKVRYDEFGDEDGAEEIDSCWGYCGDYVTSGLEDAAIQAADSYLASAGRDVCEEVAA